jgi:hypothetical protein
VPDADGPLAGQPRTGRRWEERVLPRVFLGVDGSCGSQPPGVDHGRRLDQRERKGLRSQLPSAVVGGAVDFAATGSVAGSLNGVELGLGECAKLRGCGETAWEKRGFRVSGGVRGTGRCGRGGRTSPPPVMFR